MSDTPEPRGVTPPPAFFARAWNTDEPTPSPPPPPAKKRPAPTTYRIPVYKSLWVKEPACVSIARGISGGTVPTITHPGIAAHIITEYLEGADKTHLVVLLLNTKHLPIGISTIAIGDLDECPAVPRAVFRAALLANATCIVLGHNHPSGDTSPSRADRDVTRRMRAAGELLGVELLDHVIVGGEGGCYVSLAGVFAEDTEDAPATSKSRKPRGERKP